MNVHNKVSDLVLCHFGWCIPRRPLSGYDDMHWFLRCPQRAIICAFLFFFFLSRFVFIVCLFSFFSMPPMRFVFQHFFSLRPFDSLLRQHSVYTIRKHSSTIRWTEWYNANRRDVIRISIFIQRRTCGEHERNNNTPRILLLLLLYSNELYGFIYAIMWLWQWRPKYRHRTNCKNKCSSSPIQHYKYLAICLYV